MQISIITTCLNNRETIEDTFQSIFKQSYPDIEYIVVDGESTDGTREIINRYANKISKIIMGPDNGIYDGMNKGILAASGDIIGFLNADDMFYDDSVVQRIVSAFSSDTIDCVYGDLVYVSCKDLTRITRVWKSRVFCDGLFEKSWTPAHPTFYCKRDLYVRLGLYRTDFRIAADTELMYRFLQKNHIKSKYIDVNFVRMRNSGVSSSGIKSTITIIREMKRAIIENGGHFSLIKYLFFKILKVGEIIKVYARKGSSV